MQYQRLNCTNHLRFANNSSQHKYNCNTYIRCDSFYCCNENVAVEFKVNERYN